MLAGGVSILALLSGGVSAQTLAIGNASNFFGGFGTTTGPSGTKAVKFTITNSGTTGTAADWCAVDPFHGGTIVSSGTTASIPAGGSVTVTPAALHIGYYDLYADTAGAGCQGVGFAAASLAVIRDNTTVADIRFGVNMLAGVNLAQKYIGFVPQIATAMVQAGFSGTRDQIYWKSLETSAGTYNWPATQPTPPCTSTMAPITGFVCLFNNSYNAFNNNLLTIGFGNQLYTGTNTTPPTTTTQLNAFDNYIAALLQPLASVPGKINPSFIDALGAWNEYSNDNNQFCNGCSSDIATRGGTYQTLLGNIRANATGSLIGGAGTSLGLPWWYIGQPVTPATAADALDIHPYSANADTLQPDLASFATYVNATLSKPIWATEYGPGFGSVAPTDPTYKTNLAGYPAKAAAIMLYNGVTTSFWYPAADNPNSGKNETRSLLQGDANLNNYFPSPAFVAYDTMIRQLSGYTVDKSFDRTAGTGDNRVHAYHFKKGTGNLYVIWMSSGTATVSFTAGAPTGTDALGTAVTFPASLTTDLPIFVSGSSTLSAPAIMRGDTLLASSLDDFALDLAPAGCTGSGIICPPGGSEPGASALNNWQYGKATSGIVSTTGILWTADFETYSWQTSANLFKTSRTGQSPGGNPVGRAWIAPAAASNVVLNGHFRDTSDATTSGVAVAIYKNGTQIWPSSGGPLTLGVDGYATFQNVSAGSVAMGDEITFVTQATGSSAQNEHSEIVAYISH